MQPKIGLHWVNEYRQMSGLPAHIELFQGLRLYIGAGQIEHHLKIWNDGVRAFGQDIKGPDVPPRHQSPHFNMRRCTLQVDPYQHLELVVD